MLHACIVSAWSRIRVMSHESSEDDPRDAAIRLLEKTLSEADEAMSTMHRAADAQAQLHALEQALTHARATRDRLQFRQAATADLRSIADMVQQMGAAQQLVGAPLKALHQLLDSAGVTMRDRLTPRVLEFLEKTYISERNLGEDARRHVQGYVRLFAKVAVDKPLNSYKREDIVKWVRTLEQVRRTYGKGGKDEAKPIRDIVRESRGHPTLGRTTIEKHVTHLKALFKAAAAHHRFATDAYIDRMFGRIELGNAVPEVQLRKPWSPGQLTALFASPAWSGTRSRRDDVAHRHQAGPWVHMDPGWWLPVVALHTGARLEELAQLHHEDLQRDSDGIPYIRVHGGGTRNVKNQNSIRDIPVHPLLVDLGFLGLFRPDGRGRVFRELTFNRTLKRWGTDYSERFTAYRRACGLYEAMRDFHSFRRTFTTAMRHRAKVDVATVAAIVGHDDHPEVREFEQTNDYTDYSVATLDAAIRRLDFEAYGVNLRVLRAVAALGAPSGTVQAPNAT